MELLREKKAAGGVRCEQESYLNFFVNPTQANPYIERIHAVLSADIWYHSFRNSIKVNPRAYLTALSYH